jgi:hypothetical protein
MTDPIIGYRQGQSVTVYLKQVAFAAGRIMSRG